MTTFDTAVPAAAGTVRVRERRRSRTTIVRLALAGVALLGIGAAATSAAWSDDAWFSSAASAASVELAGSTSASGTFVNADSVADGVQITVDGFANLVPGATRTATIYLKNSSTAPLSVALDATTTNATGVFAGSAPATVTVTGTPSTLAAGATSDAITVTVAAPTTWPDSYRGATGGQVTLQFHGTTTGA